MPCSAAGSTLDIRLKEHQRHIRLVHPDNPAVAEHSINNRHRIQFHSGTGGLADPAVSPSRINRVAELKSSPRASVVSYC
jgi:hypothetical protein